MGVVRTFPPCACGCTISREDIAGADLSWCSAAFIPVRCSPEKHKLCVKTDKIKLFAFSLFNSTNRMDFCPVSKCGKNLVKLCKTVHVGRTVDHFLWYNHQKAQNLKYHEAYIFLSVPKPSKTYLVPGYIARLSFSVGLTSPARWLKTSHIGLFSASLRRFMALIE